MERVDPLRDHPDAGLARRALENVRHTVVQGLELGELEPYTELFLPTAAFMEKDGHYTDWEGRGQRLRRVRSAPGIAQEDWEIFAGLARAMDGDLGFATLDALQEEFGALLAPRDVEGFGFESDATPRPHHRGSISIPNSALPASNLSPRTPQHPINSRGVSRKATAS